MQLTSGLDGGVDDVTDRGQIGLQNLRSQLRPHVSSQKTELDGTHTRWVKAVFEICYEEPSSPRELAFFLTTIVSQSEGRLNSKYKEYLAARGLRVDRNVNVESGMEG